ncbi:MAG: PP2C family protein-serine/threonine phosphatase, partial [Phycisphaeraceae bacterium]|nr:PP2C family protein-serine/threonine phosphatase [Phycisphaeraceae bacterium]
AFSVPIVDEDESDGDFRSLEGPGGASIETAHLATLKEFGFRLSRLPNAKERLNLLCRLMVRRDFFGEQACVLRVRKDRMDAKPEFLCDPHARVGDDEQQTPHISRGLLNMVKQTDMPAMATQQPNDPGAVELSIDQDAAGGDMAAMACPLRSTRFFMDLLYVIFPAHYGTAEWLALVSLAAHQLQQTEIAIEAQQHAKAHAKIEEELAKAQQIQQRLIPETPNVRSLEVNIGYKPCRWVGGDYADAVEGPDGRVLLCVADVSGKGLGAALITSSLHTMIHSLMRAGQELGPIMSNLNDHLCEFLEDRAFVTMAVVIVDPETGRMQYINAGHPPPILFDAAGDGRLLPSGEYYPLGVHEQQFEAQTAELQTGQMLAMATDGLTELSDSEGNAVGVGGLVHKLCEIRKLLSVAATVHRVAEGLSEVLDRTQGMAVSQDDRTFLLAMRSEGSPADRPPPSDADA